MLLLSSFQTFAAEPLRITTAADFSTPENESKVIELTINENHLGRKIRSRGNMKSRYGYSDGFFNLKGEGAEQISNIHGGFDLNTISVITSGFKSLGYELTINENRLGGSVSNQGFEKLTGADADKFTLAGNKLTFIAKYLFTGSMNKVVSRIKIKIISIRNSQICNHFNSSQLK
jgi:hypothetical protein